MTKPAIVFWGDDVLDEAIRTVGSLATAGYVENTANRGGVGTATIAGISARFTADRTRRNWNQVFAPFRRRGAAESDATIKAGIAAWIAALTHTRYIVVGQITNPNVAAEQGPAGVTYLAIKSLNDELRTLYGDRFYDAQEFLVYRGQAAGNANSLTQLGPSSADQDADGTLVAAAYNALMADLRRHMRSIGQLGGATKSQQIAAASGIQTRFSSPAITSADSGSVDEQRPYSIQLTSSTPNVLWEISGGTDAALFYLDSDNVYSRSVLKMRGKDFEFPTDANGDNVYTCIVRCSDGLGHHSEQVHSVTVNNTDDATVFTETSDYVTRQTGPTEQAVSDARDRFIRRLVRDGLWAKHSGLYIPASQDIQAALLQAKSATGPLVNSGAFHIAYQGFEGDGVDDIINGPTLAALDPTLNNANLGAYVYLLTNSAADTADFGCSSSANLKLMSRTAGNMLRVNALSATPTDIACTNSAGLSGFQMTGPRSGFVWKGAIPNDVETIGGVAAELTHEHTQLPTGTLQFLGAQGAAFSNRIFSGAGILKDATAEDWALLEAAWQEFINTIIQFLPQPIPAARFTCNFNGANGATTATDEGGGKTITFLGAAALSTADPLEGSASLSCPSAGAYCTVPDSPDWQLPLQWSIRCRFKPTDLTAPNQTLVSHWNTTGDQRSYQVRITSTGRLQFFYSTTGVNSITIQSDTGVIVLNREYEVLVDRDAAGVIRLYLADITDGLDVHSNMIVSTIFAGDVFDSSAVLAIGNIENGTNQFTGLIDYVHIWKDTTICGSDAGYDVAPIVVPPVEDFKVINILRFPNNPDFSPYGMKYQYIGYESSWWPGGNAVDTPNTSYITTTRVPLIQSQNPGIQLIGIDIERWNLVQTGINQSNPVAFVPNAEFNLELQRHAQVLDAIHAADPALGAFYYGEFPCRDSLHLSSSDPQVNADRKLRWQQRNDAVKAVIGNKVAILAPSMYAITTTLINSQTAWAAYANDMIDEAFRVADGKPVIPVLAIEPFETTPEHTDTWNYDRFYAMLQVCFDNVHCNGVMVWSRLGGAASFFPAGTLLSPPNPSIYSSQDPGDWWEATKQFIIDKAITL
jgi:hypothetical protein